MDDLVTWLRGVLDEDERRWLPELSGWKAGDPDWHLADIAAKRAILDLHVITVERRERSPFNPITGERQKPAYEPYCEICGWASEDPTSACLTIRLLASAYADRPGWQEAWRP